MHGIAPLILLLALASACAGCGVRQNALGGPTPVPTPSAAVASSPAAGDEADESPRELLGDLAAVHEDGGPLTYNGYVVTKEVRSERLYAGFTDESEYAVISRGGRPRLRLDGVETEAAGPFVRLGLFPVLGDGAQQLIVEQEIHREWRYWVVDLSAVRPRVVFDSGDYNVGHELRAADLDGDGRLELIQLLHTFWFFHFNKTLWFSNPDSPLIEVVFRYDPRARKYLPANHEFQDFTLRGVRREVEAVGREREQLKTGDGPDTALLSVVLGATLRYLYADRPEEGWAFYKQYDSPHREQVKAKVKKALADDPVYRAITKKGGRRTSPATDF